MPSRTSSTKLRTDSTRPPADCDKEVAMPVGVNSFAFCVSLRTTIAPTARPTPSQSSRFIAGGSLLQNLAAGGLAALLEGLAHLARLLGVAAGRDGLAQAVPERGHLD